MTAARSAQLFGIYLLLIGVPQILFPEAFYRAFQKELPSDHTSFILAAVTVALGYYYLVFARHNVTIFFQASVVGRLFVSTVAIFAVAKGMAAPTILTHFVIEVIAALTTAFALIREGERPIPWFAPTPDSDADRDTTPATPARSKLRHTSEDQRFVEAESVSIAHHARANR